MGIFHVNSINVLQNSLVLNYSCDAVHSEIKARLEHIKRSFIASKEYDSIIGESFFTGRIDEPVSFSHLDVVHLGKKSLEEVVHEIER